MIKIFKYGEVENAEIFARMVPQMDVAGIVKDIIEDVKEQIEKTLSCIIT